VGGKRGRTEYHLKVKVVVEGKGRDKSTERGSVHDEE